MKNIWLFVIFALFVQEPASTDAAIFQIREHHLSLLLVNLIWLVATVIDIYVGYKLGKWIQIKFQNTKFTNWSIKWATRIENFVGRRGEKFALILLGVINVPYLNSFFASWLQIPFKNIFTLIFIGDIVYWSIEWGINIGVRNYIVDPHVALYTIIGIALIFSVLSKTIMSKVLKDTNIK